MATKHAKCMRCLVWQTALRHWEEFRTILLKKIQLKIRRLYALINELKRQYKLLKEPDVEMTKAYQVAGYYHEVAMHATVRRIRNKSKYLVNEEQNVESIDKKEEFGIATLIEYICTGEDSQDEFEQENSELNIDPPAKPANGSGADEHGQRGSGSSASTTKGTGADEQSASSSTSSAPKEKYTGTKPKNVKRLQRNCELVSASNIQVPHVIENLKHATAVLDLSLRRYNDADDEKTMKNGQINDRKKDVIRNTTDGNWKICGPTPPPWKKEPPPDRRLDDAGDNGKVCRDKHDDDDDKVIIPLPSNEKEPVPLDLSGDAGDNGKVCRDKHDDDDDKVIIPLPRNEKEPVPLDLSMKKFWLGEEPIGPKLSMIPELPPEFESKVDYALSFLDSYSNLHTEMETLSSLDPTMRKSIKTAMQEELQKHLDKNQFLMNGVEWVKLGKYKTKIKKRILCDVDWTLSGIEITRHLLVHIFGVKTLETHNLTGNGYTQLAEDMPIAEMSILDEHAVRDLEEFLFIMKGQPSGLTRDIIDDTCELLYNEKLETAQEEKEKKLKKQKQKKARKPQRKYGRRR
ncbi:uncharacterized protein LOC105217197 [Zeugodacus cucurbitae]|uniref:uncharacterized protein LOC105217197 n=1 Tax=Zeugodacus cucurbitae TaxID=28588 RepID=UPI0023D8FE64|nr:uncharacterized protein LOC105217197 [Zeugodacus cucurbitae]XP_054082900.1 uncharacterized protein LOC105217197 [Zeugodacus cucurbitae]